MADTVTVNFGWVQPEVSGSFATWGNKLNNDLALIDAQVYALQQSAATGGTSVGMIIMYAGTTPPTGWLWCDGASYSTTTQHQLFTKLGYSFGGSGGTFNVPNLMGNTPVGYSSSDGGASWPMGYTGGEINHTLTYDELPAHAHGVSDPGHAHSVYDPAHAHGVSQSPHAHGVSDPGHAHSVSGVVTATSGAGVGSGGPAGVYGSVNTSASGVGIGIQAANANIGIAGAVTGIGIYGAGTGVSIQNAGSNYEHNNMQPYCVIGFIIKAQ